MKERVKAGGKMYRNCLLNLGLVFVLLVTLILPVNSANVITLNGAGATFPYPIYSKWFDEYHKIKPEIQINYQSIGSGGGIRQILERTVDFGATDGPMNDEQLAKSNEKLLHIPTVLGAVVPVFNIAGIKNLSLSEKALAEIYLGKITNWNNEEIQKTNPGVKFPNLPITVVHRSDGSGTTYCFVDYLSKINSEWKEKVGSGTSVNWPIGLGSKGNEGVSGLIKQTPNSIGYVELIYAEQNKLPYAAVRNASGKFIKASIETVTEEAKGSASTMPKDFRVSITNSQGENAYPISTYTWLLVYGNMQGKKGEILKSFLAWMLDEGQKVAPALGYAPLPLEVVNMVKKAVEGINITNLKA